MVVLVIMDSGISIWKDHEPRLLLRLGLIDVMSLMRLRMPMLRMTKLQMILLPALGLRMLQLMLSMPREPVENLRVLQYPGGLQ